MIISPSCSISPDGRAPGEGQMERLVSVLRRIEEKGGRGRETRSGEALSQNG